MINNNDNIDNIDNIGKIVRITNSVIDLEFNSLPKINNLVKVKTKEGVEYTFEILQHLTSNTCRAMAYENIRSLSCNNQVIDTKKQLQIPFSSNLYNQTFDSLGNSNNLDSNCLKINIEYNIPSIEELVTTKKLIYTGMPIIDLLFPITLNSKTGIVCSDLASNNIYYKLINVFTKNNNNPIVFVEVGKSLSELQELDSKIKEYDLANRTVIVQSEARQTSLNRLRTVTSGIAIATNIRDINNQDSFFFLDGGLEYLQANLEVFKLLGKEVINHAQIIGELEEKIVSTKKGNITSLQKILIPNNNYTGPIINNFSDHFDTLLIVGNNHKINYHESYSENLNIIMVGAYHIELAIEVRKKLSNYHKLKNKINVVNWNDLTFNDQEELLRGKKLEDFLYSHSDLSDFDSLLEFVRELVDI